MGLYQNHRSVSRGVFLLTYRRILLLKNSRHSFGLLQRHDTWCTKKFRTKWRRVKDKFVRVVCDITKCQNTQLNSFVIFIGFQSEAELRSQLLHCAAKHTGSINQTTGTPHRFLAMTYDLARWTYQQYQVVNLNSGQCRIKVEAFSYRPNILNEPQFWTMQNFERPNLVIRLSNLRNTPDVSHFIRVYKPWSAHLLICAGNVSRLLSWL